MKPSKIEVIYLADANEEDTGYEVWMDFLDWMLCISLGEGDESNIWDNIIIYTKSNGDDVTDDFFAWKKDEDTIDGTRIHPTGGNLYQVMDILRTNYKQARRAA